MLLWLCNYALLYGIQKLKLFMHTFTMILHMHFTQAYVYLFISYSFNLYIFYALSGY